METVLERNTIENAEKQKHNAMINERYRRLLDAVEDQVSTPVKPAETTHAPAYTPETPAYDTMPVAEQTPVVREYAPSQLAASVFTAEKFQRLEGFAEAPAQNIAPVQQATASVKTTTAPAVRYSLTPLAKLVMAIFTLVVVVMLTLIGVNSQAIQRKSIRLKNLEEKKQELMEKNEEIQRYIQELQTEESIIERATNAGMLN